MIKILFITVLTFLSGAAFADIIPLKVDGDYSMIENPKKPGVFKEVYVMYIENGMARVRADVTIEGNVFSEFWLATVPVAALVRPVDSYGEFRMGDKVCTNKKFKSFREGFCSQVHRLYENGYVELWKGLFTSKLLVQVQDIEHKN